MLTRTQEVDSTDSINQNVLVQIAGRNVNTHNEETSITGDRVLYDNSCIKMNTKLANGKTGMKSAKLYTMTQKLVPSVISRQDKGILTEKQPIGDVQLCPMPKMAPSLSISSSQQNPY